MGKDTASTEVLYHILGPEEKLAQGVSEDPTVSLVDSLLYDAIVQHASDIHLQPQRDMMVVRYRIDGVLYNQQNINKDRAQLCLSRLKVLSNLDISQRRVPQDGRFCAVITRDMQSSVDSSIDFRISTFPALHGEKMVIRILDRSLRLLTLDNLGLSPDIFMPLSHMIMRPHGLFLVTGPTGCGKTTMLYALISAMNMGSKNIVTIEDPIEYELTGITQSNVAPKIGFTFENGLRAILRQDPDVIMVGEIRDKVTAYIAIEAALTGHLVVSTLHTNDAPSAVTRLLEMGIEPFLINATLIGVLAQRLVRRLCSLCKQKIVCTQTIDSNATKTIELQASYTSKGCKDCHSIGYKGRVGLFELFMADDAVRELIMKKSDIVSLRHYAQSRGMKTLFDDGLEKVNEGITTLDEILVMKVDAGIS